MEGVDDEDMAAAVADANVAADGGGVALEYGSLLALPTLFLLLLWLLLFAFLFLFLESVVS